MPRNSKVYSSIMVNIVKRCFSKVLNPNRGFVLLCAFAWQLPAFGASSSPVDMLPLAGQEAFVILALSLLLILLLVYYRKNRYGLSLLTRKHYTYLEVSKSKQQIGLYRHHQTNTDTVLNIGDIVSSKIILNDKLINLVTPEQADIFNGEQEKRLQQSLARIRAEKLLNGQIRKINLVLTDKQHKSYAICLYLRRGNRRFTKTRYLDVVEDIIEWCRLLSSHINTYHSLAAPTPAVDTPPPARPNSKPAQPPEEQAELSERDEFLNALERLAKLKQEGLLSDSEFTQAKSKLLDLD